MKKILALTLMSTALFACSQGQQFSLGNQSENFGQSIVYNNRVDVLFVMDNSSGMAIYNSKLQSTIPTLVNALLAQKLDLHVAVITSSMGGSNPNGGRFLGSPKYFTSSSPNLAASVVSRLTTVGDDGSDLERGLDSLERVLLPSYQKGEGTGFIRSDALLAVISLSTEDDKSSDISGGSAAYAAYLDQSKGFYDDGTRRWVMNFIGVLSLSGNCNTTGDLGYKEPGVRWMDLATTSNGVTSSICATDLSSAASNVKARISQILTDYRLSKKPDESTLHVYLNNVEIPRNTTNGWDYIASGNLIRFYGSAVPAADANIRVDFRPASAN